MSALKLLIDRSTDCIRLRRFVRRPDERKARCAAALLVVRPPAKRIVGVGGPISAVAMVVLAVGLNLGYNIRVTGSAWISPYQAHERQYQRAPMLTFLPPRTVAAYGSQAIERYYQEVEKAAYLAKLSVTGAVGAVVGAARTSWSLWYGPFLAVPCVVLAMQRGGWCAALQVVCVLAWCVLAGAPPTARWATWLGAGATLTQIAVSCTLCWGSLARRSIVAVSALLLEAAVTRWYFPHYLAPASVFIIVWQVDMYRHMRARGRNGFGRWAKWLTHASLICACLDKSVDAISVTDRPGMVGTLSVYVGASDWSVQRSTMDAWLKSRNVPSIVFVRYAPNHVPMQEWIHNAASISTAKVVWARDLGDARNQELVASLGNRQLWSLDADRTPFVLVEYANRNGRQQEYSRGKNYRENGVLADPRR